MRDSGAELKAEIAAFREELESRMALTNDIMV